MSIAWAQPMGYYQMIRAVIGEDWRQEQLRTRRTLITRHHIIDRLRNCRASMHPASTGLAFPSEFLAPRVDWHPHAGDASRFHNWEF
ncbi:MAG: hypothetical protein KDA52_19495, partial [Planctomycetaceae bacterium]|nr:hypothetical protein [Planctomycetaceae bacterium]